VYDGGFEVLQWLPSPSLVPPAQLLKAWCVTVKVLPDISAISALTARKTWQLQFTYTASQPGTHQKIIDMAMNGIGCRASARIMGVSLNTILRHLKTQAAVGKLTHTTGQ
jgi:hypothetical protein